MLEMESAITSRNKGIREEFRMSTNIYKYSIPNVSLVAKW